MSKKTEGEEREREERVFLPSLENPRAELPVTYLLISVDVDRLQYLPANTATALTLLANAKGRGGEEGRTKGERRRRRRRGREVEKRKRET